MATNTEQREADYTCPVCCDIFTDPVVLLCGHSFCQHCLQEWWRKSKLRTCPVCKEIFPMTRPPRNLALRNLSDSLRQERSRSAGSKDLCSLHGEKFKLFCENDQQPICLVCRDAKAHKKHDCVPINEAAEVHRAKIRLYLLNLKSKRGSFEKQKENWNKIARHIQRQAQQTEKTIRAEFQKLYQFLRAEEAGRIDACRKEAKLKSDAMNLKLVNLTAEISELVKKIKTIEDEMRTDDLSFMLNVKATLNRSLYTQPEPKTPPGALIDEAKHISNLQFSVWKKMGDTVQYTPVTLDPNTSCRSLAVLDNLTKSTEGSHDQSIPDIPERLGWSDILGYQGLNSGKHSWDVEVDGHWAVGVAVKGASYSEYRNIWAIYMCPCSDVVLLNLSLGDNATVIAVNSIPKRIRVQFDYDKGISFFDLDRKKIVHAIKYTFKEKVFPYFRNDVKILPTTLSISINHPRFTI